MFFFTQSLHGKPNFLFPDVLERWSFQKNRAGIWSFSYYWERSCFSFSKYDLNLRRKMKDDLFQKNTRKYDIFFRPPEKKVFSRKAASGHDLFCIIWKDGFFFPKTRYFFLGRKPATTFLKKYMEIFSVYTRGCYRPGVTPPCQKKSRMALSRKNPPKGDWRSRLTSWKELQQVSVTSQRPLRAFSCIALQQKKPGNLINRIEAWLLLQFIRLEIFYNE